MAGSRRQSAFFQAKPMKYYENLDPLERKKLVLRAVAVDSYMEGMDQSVEDCLTELRDLDTSEPEARDAGANAPTRVLQKAR